MKKFAVTFSLIIFAIIAMFVVPSIVPQIYAENNWQHEGVTSNIASPQSVNKKIELTTNTSGETTNLEYKFVWMKNDWNEWGVIRHFSPDNTASWMPKEEGDYKIYADVKDANSKTLTKTISYKINNSWSLDTVTSDKPSGQVQNTAITFTSKTNGETTGLQYKFVWMKNNWAQWGVIRDLNTNNTASWIPKEEGDYTIYADVKDTNGNISTKTIPFSIKPSWAYSSITTNKTSPQKTDTAIELTANISGDTTGLQYKFVWMKNNWAQWGVIRDLSPNNTTSWIPKEEGDYTIYVDVKDINGKIVVKTTPYKISNYWKHEGITSDKASPQKNNTSIAFTAKTSGETTDLQYKFVWMKNDWEQWGVIKELDSSNTTNWKPTDDGFYTIYADIKDTSGKIITKTIGYEIESQWYNDGITASVSSPQKPNTSIKLQANTRGYTSDLQYKFVWMKNNWAQWGVIQKFSSSNSANWTPTENGEYNLYLDVKDSTGKMVTTILPGYKITSGNVTMTGLTISNSSASVPAGKTFYLKAVPTPSSESVYFSTNNSSVATVSARGLVYGVNPGTASITAYDKTGSIVRTCSVTVTQSQPVKFAYTSPNNATINSQVSMIAITDKTRDAVKFVVNGNEINAQKTATEGETYIWTAKILANSTGETSAVAYARKNGVWSTCSDANTSIYVTSASVSEAKVEKRRISDKGIDFIAQCEGFSSTVYDDAFTPDTPTVGYGKVIYGGDLFYNNLTKREGYGMLINSLNKGSYTSSVNNFLLTRNVKFSQQHFDSLVSFTYNLGAGWMNNDSTLISYINNSTEPGSSQKNLNYMNKANFSYQINRYHHAGGKCIPGLLYRRIDEMNIFFYGDYTRHAYKYNPNNFPIPDCIKNIW